MHPQSGPFAACTACSHGCPARLLAAGYAMAGSFEDALSVLATIPGP